MKFSREVSLLISLWLHFLCIFVLLPCLGWIITFKASEVIQIQAANHDRRMHSRMLRPDRVFTSIFITNGREVRETDFRLCVALVSIRRTRSFNRWKVRANDRACEEEEEGVEEGIERSIGRSFVGVVRFVTNGCSEKREGENKNKRETNEIAIGECTNDDNSVYACAWAASLFLLMMMTKQTWQRPAERIYFYPNERTNERGCAFYWMALRVAKKPSTKSLKNSLFANRTVMIYDFVDNILRLFYIDSYMNMIEKSFKSISPLI